MVVEGSDQACRAPGEGGRLKAGHSEAKLGGWTPTGVTWEGTTIQAAFEKGDWDPTCC